MTTSSPARGPGRPPLPDDERKVILSVYVTRAERDAYKRQCEKLGTTASERLAALVRRELRDPAD